MTDESKLDASKTTFILRIIVGIVMAIGLIISVLAFYILMLSIYQAYLSIAEGCKQHEVVVPVELLTKDNVDDLIKEFQE